MPPSSIVGSREMFEAMNALIAERQLKPVIDRVFPFADIGAALPPGATLTDKDGKFRLEMPQIVPIFGQPHGHLAYDSGEFKTVFLRPVMKSAKDKSLEAHFVLQPA